MSMTFSNPVPEVVCVHEVHRVCYINVNIFLFDCVTWIRKVGCGWKGITFVYKGTKEIQCLEEDLIVSIILYCTGVTTWSHHIAWEHMTTRKWVCCDWWCLEKAISKSFTCDISISLTWQRKTKQKMYMMFSVWCKLLEHQICPWVDSIWHLFAHHAYLPMNTESWNKDDQSDQVLDAH